MRRRLSCSFSRAFCLSLAASIHSSSARVFLAAAVAALLALCAFSASHAARLGDASPRE